MSENENLDPEKLENYEGSIENQFQENETEA